MRINRFLTLALATSLLIGCAKIKVVKVPAGAPTPADGVIYALPNTVVRVLVKVNRTREEGVTLREICRPSLRRAGRLFVKTKPARRRRIYPILCSREQPFRHTENPIPQTSF